jgi:hypothetical protein
LVLVALLVLDLFSATMPFNPVDEDLVASYREPEITEFLESTLEDEEPFRVDVRHPGLLPNFGMTEGFHVASGVFDPMQPAAYTAMHNVLAENPALPGYDLLNVRYWIVEPDADPVDGFEVVFESDSGAQVWERQSALPRAWIVTDVQDVSHEDQIDALRDPGFDPAVTVLLDDPPFAPAGDGEGSVQITRFAPEHITLEVSVDGPAYLVLSEGTYPGWSVEIDGESASVMTANFGVRSIPLDESSSEIELRYEPGFVTLGLISGGLGGLLLLGLLVGPVVVSRIPDNRAE